ncbi:MAG: redoxin protein [Burkholderiales bacterium]|jgi:thiol-disulfide isomerase/thioredoxin|nr:redoxin protein [Burkholderiales bacterium]
MKFAKKLFTKLHLIIAAIFLSIGFGIHYYNLDPLEVSLDDREHKLKNFVKPDKVLVVSFWASWCPHCLREIGKLKRFKEKHPEIAVLGLKVDEGSAETVFQDTTGYPSFDASMHGAQIMQLFGNYTAALPFTVILDNEKRKTLLGETSPEELEKNISAVQENIHKS